MTTRRILNRAFPSLFLALALLLGAGAAEAWQAEVDGNTVTFDFGHTLDTGRVLKTEYFGAVRETDGAAALSVAGAGFTAAGAGLRITLSRALEAGEAIRVTYRWPRSGHGLWTVSGYQIDHFSLPVRAPGAPAAAGLTAEFHGLPAAHDGRQRFEFELRFSEEIAGLTLSAVRSALSVTGGRLIDVKRTARGKNGKVTVRVRPASAGEVTVALAATSDCAAEGAICAKGGRKLQAVSAAVPGPAPAANAPAELTAAFHGMPASHDGSRRFEFEIRFSDEVAGPALRAIRNALSVTGGQAVAVKRTTAGQSRNVTVQARPDGPDDVTISLPATADCGAADAICTADRRRLAAALTAKVGGPVAVSVADAKANEADPAVAFTVSLNRAASGEVTVDYATRDGTAKAGEDYTRTRGTLTFAAGETEKTVNVPILDDVIDEGAETFTFKLMNAVGAAIGAGEATGTIENDDPLQKMWLARFGRTVADHVAGAVADRLAKPLTGAQVTVGGQTVNLSGSGETGENGGLLNQALTGAARALGASGGPSTANDDGAGPERAWESDHGHGPGLGIGGPPADRADTAGRTPSGRELLLGSAFHMAKNGDGGGRPGLAAWGRVTVGGFDGEAPADGRQVSIDGEVVTGVMGADAEWNRLLAGLAVSVSEGDGSFDLPGVDKGSIESGMTAVSPYARYMVSDRLSVWGLAGFGTGDMTIVQDARGEQPRRVTRTDIGMRLVAGGGRGQLMEAGEAGGVDLALKADAFWAGTEADPISNEGGTKAEASRMRLALEGSRAFEMEDGGAFTPGLELGLRHDGGDAETGAGVEIGGRVSYQDPETGFSVEGRVRVLAAHEDSDYKEWGASGSVRLAPGEGGRGLSFSLAPTYGAAQSGVNALWSARDARGLAPGSGFEAARRMEGEMGYGIGLMGGRLTGTPNLGAGLSDTARDYRIGWRLAPADGGRFEINLDATRREAAGAGEPPAHGAMLTGTFRW